MSLCLLWPAQAARDETVAGSAEQGRAWAMPFCHLIEMLKTLWLIQLFPRHGIRWRQRFGAAGCAAFPKACSTPRMAPLVCDGWLACGLQEKALNRS